MKHAIEVQTPSRRYVVTIGSGALEHCGTLLSAYSAVVVVADARVAELHGNRLCRVCEAAEVPTHQWVIPAGEDNKCLWQAEALFDFLTSKDLDRQGAVLACGGGMVGDLSAFVASTWLRGIDFLNCPTTLLAAADASVGGKTGLNHAGRKNRIGTFHQPQSVWIDVDLLATLDERQWASGMAECIKHAVLAEPPFLDWLEAHCDALAARSPEDVAELIARNVRTKAAVVARDEQDRSGDRARLNFGHTLGHALESASGYRLSHGEAVAVGMVGAMRIATLRGAVRQAEMHRLEQLLQRSGLPTRLPAEVRAEDVLAALVADKKNVGGRPRFVLPQPDGRITAGHVVEDYVVMEVLADLSDGGLV